MRLCCSPAVCGDSAEALSVAAGVAVRAVPLNAKGTEETPATDGEGHGDFLWSWEVRAAAPPADGASNEAGRMLWSMAI